MLSIAVFLFLFKEYCCFLVLPQSDRSFVLPPVNGTFEGKLPFLKKGINSAIRERPTHWDWRIMEMVSPVKNQAGCAACWAFSIVANIESHLRIYRMREDILSEQFLIDCDDAQHGCKDGSILATFGNIVATLGGVLRSTDYYPYVEERGPCRWKLSTPGSLDKKPTPIPVYGFQRVMPNEEIMAELIHERGPLSAAINSASMSKYEGGIDEPTDENCNPNELNHAVLIVGYNVYISEDGKETPYWIIKNSWGTDWGDKGFYYLVSGRNACGIASDVSFAYV